VAPGAGLELGFGDPFAEQWQLDLSLRTDYVPYRFNANAIGVAASRNVLGAASVSLRCIPSTRISAALTDRATLDYSRLEFMDQGPQDWKPLASYDSRKFENNVELSVACQMAYNLSAYLLGSLTYVNEERGNLWSRGGIPASGQSAFDMAYAGQPYFHFWGRSLNCGISYRFF
jgi:hypothetical protein